MAMVVRFCSTCSSPRAFETVPCVDGHGRECPDLMCIECGYVVVAGFVEESAPVDELLIRSVA
jgi:hypothetical protein